MYEADGIRAKPQGGNPWHGKVWWDERGFGFNGGEGTFRFGWKSFYNWQATMGTTGIRVFPDINDVSDNFTFEVWSEFHGGVSGRNLLLAYGNFVRETGKAPGKDELIARAKSMGNGIDFYKIAGIAVLVVIGLVALRACGG